MQQHRTGKAGAIFLPEIAGSLAASDPATIADRERLALAPGDAYCPRETGRFMKIHLYQGDLPDGLDLGKLVAIDTETLGLNPHRDRLCLAQLSSGDGVCHAVQFAAGDYAAPNLKRLLADPSVTKLFHFARFDVAMFRRYLGVDLLADLLHQDRLQAGAHLYRPSRPEGSGAGALEHRIVEGTAELGLGRRRTQRKAVGLCRQRCGASACVERRAGCHAGARRPQRISPRPVSTFLPARAELDLAGWEEVDIFAH